MVYREQFVQPILPMVNKAIYVWGRVGEEVESEAWIRRYETSTTNANRAIALWKKRIIEGVNPIQAFDCSGLIVFVLRYYGLDSLRYTAQGFNRISKRTSNPQIGDFAFKFDSNGNAYHIGIISKPGFVIEAEGRDAGVVENRMTGWYAYGINPFVKESTMLKRGDRGDVVGAWQRALISWNPNALPRFKADKDFGSETETWTNYFKKDMGIPQDGVVNDLTWGWMTDYLAANSGGVSQEDYNKVLQQLADCNADALGFQNLLYALQNDVTDVADAFKRIDIFIKKHG